MRKMTMEEVELPEEALAALTKDEEEGTLIFEWKEEDATCDLIAFNALTKKFCRVKIGNANDVTRFSSEVMLVSLLRGARKLATDSGAVKAISDLMEAQFLQLRERLHETCVAYAAEKEKFGKKFNGMHKVNLAMQATKLSFSAVCEAAKGEIAEEGDTLVEFKRDDGLLLGWMQMSLEQIADLSHQLKAIVRMRHEDVTPARGRIN